MPISPFPLSIESWSRNTIVRCRTISDNAAMFEFSTPYPGWLYGALAAGMVALIAVARSTAISDRLRNWLLFVPRLGVFSLLLAVLLNPVWRQELRLPAQP